MTSPRVEADGRGGAERGERSRNARRPSGRGGERSGSQTEATRRLTGLTLVLEASTSKGNVAVLSDGVILADVAVAMGRGGGGGGTGQDERLMPAVASALAGAGVGVRELTRVVCGSGPGGFTGLRIAAALAKGIVTGAGARLAAVPSLLLIAAGALERLDPGTYLATLDALRGERYASLVIVEADPPESASPARGGHPGSALERRRIVSHGAARRLSSAAADAWADETGAEVIGPGCAIEAWPESRGVVHVEEAVQDVDLATWEPDYGRLAEAEVKRAAAGGSGD